MNDGKLDLTWDSIGMMHRRTDRDNLRSGYGAGAYADGQVDWVFSQPKSGKSWATVAFADADYDNPESPDPSFIDQSMDFTFSY